jgi:hypothetical protein
MTLERLITLASDCAPKETMDRVAVAVTESLKSDSKKRR